MHVHTFKGTGRRVIRVEPGEFAVPDDDDTVLVLLEDLRRVGLSLSAVALALGVNVDTPRWWSYRRCKPNGQALVALRALHRAAMNLAQKEGIV